MCAKRSWNLWEIAFAKKSIHSTEKTVFTPKPTQIGPSMGCFCEKHKNHETGFMDVVKLISPSL